VRIVGTLRKNSTGRWEIVDDRDDSRALELTSGDVCEVLIGGHWIMTRVEFAHAKGGGGVYYPVERGVRLWQGLPARVPDRRD
jgi:hypothetical protein